MPIAGQAICHCDSVTAIAILVMAGSALSWHGLFLYTNMLNEAYIEAR